MRKHEDEDHQQVKRVMDIVALCYPEKHSSFSKTEAATHSLDTEY